MTTPCFSTLLTIFIFINVPPKYLIICVTSIYCYSKFKTSGMHMTRKYCSIQLCHTIPSSASAVFLLCVSTHTHTHTHTHKTSQPTLMPDFWTQCSLTIAGLWTTMYVKGSSNIWAYPKRITHINDEETMPIYVRTQTLQTKPYLLQGAGSANQ